MDLGSHLGCLKLTAGPSLALRPCAERTGQIVIDGTACSWYVPFDTRTAVGCSVTVATIQVTVTTHQGDHIAQLETDGNLFAYLRTGTSLRELVPGQWHLVQSAVESAIGSVATWLRGSHRLVYAMQPQAGSLPSLKGGQPVHIVVLISRNRNTRVLYVTLINGATRPI